MKRALNAPLWLLPVILIVISLYYGCRKNDLPVDKHAQAVKIFESIKEEFDKQGLSAKLNSELNDSMSLSLVPNWNQGFTIYDNDSNLCYYMPISGMMRLKNKKETADVKFDKVVRYLVAQKKGKQLEFFETTVIPKNFEEKRLSFTGDMMVRKLADNKKAIFTYLRGTLENGTYYARKSNQGDLQSAQVGCLYYHECTWTSPCDGTFTVVYTRGQGHPSQTLDCGIPQLNQCPTAQWTATANGWEVFCNNDPIDPLPPVYPPPGGSNGGGGGQPDVDPIHPSYNDFGYICPQAFQFVIVTTHELWQTACIANAHCNIKFYDGDSRQYVERHVEVPKMYFQCPFKDTFGIVVLTPYMATLYATQAFNDGENAMHDAFKADIYLTSSQLSSLWLSTANSIFLGLTRGAGRVTATPPFNSINTIPIVNYVACP